MYAVGPNIYGGLFTKTQFLRGKGAKPGTKASLSVDGVTKEFIAVKLASGTIINGIAVLIDSSASGGNAAVTASAAPAALIHARVGILTFASATATQTMAGTAFGWAQIAGPCMAWVSASVTLPNNQLMIGNNGQLIQGAVHASASTQLKGVISVGTNTASTTAAIMLQVLLNYPQFQGLPDGNLS